MRLIGRWRGGCRCLKDGASATYGTDAVAGVVNIIPRDDFSGAEVSVFYQEDGKGDMDEELYEFILGSDTENGHFVLAGSYSTRSTLEQTERPEFLREGFEMSDTGNPGKWLVPVRDATGAIVDSAVQRDPGCGVATDIGPGGTDVGRKGNFLTGDPRSATTSSISSSRGSPPTAAARRRIPVAGRKSFPSSWASTPGTRSGR